MLPKSKRRAYRGFEGLTQQPKRSSMARVSRRTMPVPGGPMAWTTGQDGRMTTNPAPAKSCRPSTRHHARHAAWSAQVTGNQSRWDNMFCRCHRLWANPHPSAPGASRQWRGLVDTQQISGSMVREWSSEQCCGLNSSAIPIALPLVRVQNTGGIAMCRANDYDAIYQAI